MIRRGRIRLGAWLAAVTAGAVALVVGGVFIALSMRVNATTRELVATQVTQGQRTLVALRAQGDQEFVAAAALLAGSPSLRSAIATAHVEGQQDGASADELMLTVQRELERLAPDFQRDMVAATDASGRVFASYAQRSTGARADDGPVPGLDLSLVPAVRNALDDTLDGGAGSLYRSTLRVGNTWFHLAAAPIVLDGFTIGTAVLGERLDADHLRALRETFGGELVLSVADSVIASTTDAGGWLAGHHGDARREAASTHIGDIEYMMAALPVGSGDDGLDVELHLLHPVTPSIRAATRALLADFLFWGLLAVAIAGAGTAFAARRVLHPLDQFVRHLRGAARSGLAAIPRSRAPAVEIRWLHVSFARLMGTLGRKRAELEHQAYHDPLTGLPNRARFLSAVNAALAARTQGGGEVAVLFLDLDHFKTVNDALGHAVGDALLVEVGRRLAEAGGTGQLPARLGGDEFAMLLHGVAPGDAVAALVERILGMMHVPVVLDRAEVLVGVSIGVAFAAPEDSADELLRNADVAMYRAKELGRGTYAVFRPDMHAAVLERLETEADLRRALLDPDASLRLVYQPIVALEFERIAGVEALVRWDHPTRGIVSPDVFIPVAEATGMVITLGRWVLRTACRQAAEWQRADEAAGVTRTDAPYVSVNLSGRQLQDADLVSDVRSALVESGLDPARLLLEITESVLVHRADASLRVLQDLKALGVRLAIDDFGTGYSSLAYLQRFPVNVLKIDKAFIDGVAGHASATALARGIVSLAASLGLRCVAEGIEHEAQVTQLRAIGCGYGQGFFFARPMSADTVTSLLAGRTGAMLPAARHAAAHR